MLKDATNKLIEVPVGDVELLVRELTAEQVADLTAFLSSLK